MAEVATNNMECESYYARKGAYHWDWYADDSSRYHKHVEYVRQLIDNIKGESILDVGAGDGLITHLIGADGIDNDRFATILAAKKGVHVWCMDIEERIPIDDNRYDIVFMGDVIEHLTNVDVALEEVHRILKSSGRLIISTPPRRESGLRNDDHVKEYSKEELCAILEMSGFTPRLTIHNSELDKIYVISVKDG